MVDGERKGKRPDRTEKLEQRKYYDETIVKCSVGSMLLLEGENKANFMRVVNRLVDSCSRRTHYASVALNALVREMIDGIYDISEITFPPIWNETFIRQLIVGTESAKNKTRYNEIAVLYDTYPHLAPDIDRFKDDGNVYTAAAIKMATNIKTHLSENLQTSMKKYLYETTGLTKTEIFNVMNDVWGWKKEYREADDVDDDLVQQQIDLLRDMLYLDDETCIDKKWLKSEDNYDTIFKFLIFVNRSLEAHDKPLNRILPLQRLRMHHITIDSTTLFGILQKINVMSEESKNPLGHAIWDSIYNFQKVMKKDQNFVGTIDTDGVALSAHFWKYNMARHQYYIGLKHAQQLGKEEEYKKEYYATLKNKEKPDLTNKRVLGCDPGRINILTIVEVDDKGKITTYILSRERYYNDSGIFVARKKSNKWNKNVSEEILALSRNSPKSTSMEKFTNYVQLKKEIDDKLWEEYSKKRWRDQQLRLYGGKKRAFARFFNELGDLQNAVIAYGSAKLAPGGKGEISVPTSRAYKECQQRCDTYSQDEHRSSCIYWEDDSVLQLIVRKDINKTVRGLLWCSSTNNNKCKYIDRDVNGAMNIRRCFMAESIPQIMQRGNPKLERPVGKYIAC